MRQAWADRRWSPWVAGFLAGLASLLVRGQGLDLLEDGLWLLAADTLRQDGALYRELVLRDGPLDAAVLWGFFSVFGASAASLALLKSAVDALAAGLVFVAARRLGARGASWWAALGILALGPFALRYVLALAAALCLRSWPQKTRAPGLGVGLGLLPGMGLGLLLGLTALGGLDGMAMALALSILLVRELGPRPRSVEGWLPLAAPLLGFALPWGIAGLAGALQMAMPSAFDQIVVAGVQRLGNQVAAIPGWGYLRVGFGSGEASSPFRILHTGETLPAFMPGQDALREISFRARALLILPLVLLAWRHRPWRSASDRALLVFATMPLLTLLLRGNAGFVDRAWLGGLFLLPALLAALSGPRLRISLLWAMPVLLLGLPSLEFGWLASHRQRDGLSTWNRSTAGVALTDARIEEVEVLFDALGPSREPLLIWPSAPGLHFLMQRSPALPQTVLLEQRVRGGTRLAAQFSEAAPHRVLLGLAWQFGASQIDALAPGVWTQLRRDYWVFGKLNEGGLRIRVLERVPVGESLAEVALPQRLPQIEQTVGNGVGPAMRPGLEVGQSFFVGADDFAGFAVRWRTKERDLVVPVRIRVWMRREGHWGNLVLFEDLELSIPGDLHRSYIRIGPLSDTAGTELTVTFELREEIDYDLRLVWHRKDNDPQSRDFYPEGSAMLEMDPLNADLYFISW